MVPPERVIPDGTIPFLGLADNDDERLSRGSRRNHRDVVIMLHIGGDIKPCPYLC